jgi:hypothetical protein
MIPFSNEKSPEGLGKFKIPSNFPGIMEIKDLEMKLMQNIIYFGMNPSIDESFGIF